MWLSIACVLHASIRLPGTPICMTDSVSHLRSMKERPLWRAPGQLECANEGENINSEVGRERP